MSIAEVLALADRDSVNLPPMSQDKADLCAALIASARSQTDVRRAS
ncbi:MAG TPA: hypothetical protein VF506_02115 [Streptosporangiaceae bacterium]